MEEEKGSEFKVTDRRKFNPDGSPREHSDEPQVSNSAKTAQAAIEPEAAEADEAEVGTNNVVSFPGEGAKKNEPPAPAPSADAQKDEREAVARDAARRAYEQAGKATDPHLPEASFLTLLNMLGVEAAMHLGLVENPAGGEMPVDMEAARHLIDLLGMLQDKTRGNLSPDEERLLENILADLRMQYVVLSKRR